MDMRALPLLTGLVFIALPGFAQVDKTLPGKPDAEPGSGTHQIVAPAGPNTASPKEEAGRPPGKLKKQRIRLSFPPAAAKRM